MTVELARWHKFCAYEMLEDLTKSICNNVTSNGTQNAVDPEDIQIMALTTGES